MTDPSLAPTRMPGRERRKFILLFAYSALLVAAVAAIVVVLGIDAFRQGWHYAPASLRWCFLAAAALWPLTAVLIVRRGGRRWAALLVQPVGLSLAGLMSTGMLVNVVASGDVYAVNLWLTVLLGLLLSGLAGVWLVLALELPQVLQVLRDAFVGQAAPRNGD